MANRSSTPTLITLPAEVIQNIASQLRERRDLVSLSLVSKAVHEVCSECLWTSLTIKLCEHNLDHFPPFTAFDPNGSPIHYTREVHFSSDFVRNTRERCPHFHHHTVEDGDHDENDNDQGENEVENGEYDYSKDDSGDSEDGFGSSTDGCLDILAKGATSVLNQLQDGTLRSLSWDTGTCLPIRIFGREGIIDMKQSLIESLSLTTDGSCYESVDYVKVGLSSLTKLKRLRWRGPDCDDIHTLSDMIHTNAENLEHLEVDLLSWKALGRYMGLSPYDDGPRGLAHSIRFWRAPGGKISGPTYPALRTLCLTEVSLKMKSVRVFDFSVLRNLKLRNCEKWDDFLENVVRLRLPIGLKTLEVHARPGLLNCDADEVLSKFLAAFDGLEELYVGIQGPLPYNFLWTGVVAHCATLKRFVHHLRTVDHDPDYIDELDEGDLGWGDADEFLKCLDKFGLEAMGLSINAEDMMSILSSAARNTPLKILHLRQSRFDLVNNNSNFWDDVNEQEGGSSEQGTVSYRLRPQLRRLAEWAFGPVGIASLKVIACGDYAYGGRLLGSRRVDVILCRPEVGSNEAFRVLDSFDDRAKEERAGIIDMYRDFLGACPVEPLLTWE